MYTEIFDLWPKTPGKCLEKPVIKYYRPKGPKGDGAVVIFPGGGYQFRAPHEGDGYAEFLAYNGISAFVVEYRVAPHKFPLPLVDARRAVRFVRHNAEKFGINRDKIAAMGSSAGGHLTALLSTYTDPIGGELVDDAAQESSMPNLQILCYPVINLYDTAIAHIGSGDNLIGDKLAEGGSVHVRERLTPSLLVNSTTPPAFIWHTFDDQTVDVKNSIEYFEALKNSNVASEIHIFPHGRHGLGLTEHSSPLENHVAQWSNLLLNWLFSNGF
ncbi:MAG: alpha/beta hydrolase [Oscillospiraceae bacterium]|nr:alpha/beta hydrolase [Oscillospiraceae bacterium]